MTSTPSDTAPLQPHGTNVLQGPLHPELIHDEVLAESIDATAARSPDQQALVFGAHGTDPAPSRVCASVEPPGGQYEMLGTELGRVDSGAWPDTGLRKVTALNLPGALRGALAVGSNIYPLPCLPLCSWIYYP